MYVFLFPTGKYFVCILETWLAGGENSTAAGFLDQFQIKAVGLTPGIDVTDLIFYRITSTDSHCFQDRVIIFGKTGAGITGHFNCSDTVPGPGKGNSFDITHALAAPGNTVFHQIFNKICGHMELIVEEKNLLHFYRSQRLGQILFCNIKQLTDLFILFQFADVVRCKAADVVRRG